MAASLASSIPAATPVVEQIERETMRRVTRRLIPLLMISYFAAYLDRVNVGFAALTMNKALGFSAEIFGIGSGIFFVGYFLFEIPSNLILSKMGAQALDRADPSDLGHHLRGDCLRHRRLVILRHPVPAGTGRGGLLSRDHPLSHLVVSVILPLADHWHLHDGDPHLHRHRLTDIWPDPAAGRVGRPRRMAMAVPIWKPCRRSCVASS